MNHVALFTAPLMLVALTVTAAPSDLYGQKIVDQEMAAHPELALLSLHTVPPGGAQSAIIASSVLTKVGKKSDPDDLVVVETKKPEVKEMPQRQIYDLLFPLLDSSGAAIGTIVMEVKFSAESSGDGALKRGQAVQAEIRKLVKNKSQLFDHTGSNQSS